MLAFHGYPINDLQYVSSDVFYFFVDVTDQIRGKFCPRLFEDPQFKYTDTTVELLDEKTADAYDRDKISMSPYHFPIGRLWAHPNYQMLDVILGIIIGSDRIVWDCHRDLGKGNWKLVAVKIGYGAPADYVEKTMIDLLCQGHLDFLFEKSQRFGWKFYWFYEFTLQFLLKHFKFESDFHVGLDNFLQFVRACDDW